MIMIYDDVLLILQFLLSVYLVICHVIYMTSVNNFITYIYDDVIISSIR